MVTMVIASTPPPHPPRFIREGLLCRAGGELASGAWGGLVGEPRRQAEEGLLAVHTWMVEGAKPTYRIASSLGCSRPVVGDCFVIRRLAWGRASWGDQGWLEGQTKEG
jgi:hypothetical protein